MTERVERKPAAKPPRFITPLQGQMVRQGESVRLEGVYTGTERQDRGRDRGRDRDRTGQGQDRTGAGTGQGQDRVGIAIGERRRSYGSVLVGER